MTCNVGKTDRVVRLLVSVVLIGLGLYFSSWWGAIGIIPLFTAAVGWCPLYAPFGLSTCSSKS